jgi:hypothetical protein
VVAWLAADVMYFNLNGCILLWIYNLGIHNCGSDKGYMFIWSEDQAKQGSYEIGSCLLKYLGLEKPNAENLNIVSDNYRGQGKNCVLAALVTHNVFKSVEHWFPQVGHTRLPCDRDFGCIEKYVRNQKPVVYTTEEWVSLLRETCKTNPFVVTKMKQEDFKDVQSLQVNITKKHKCSDGTPCTF